MPLGVVPRKPREFVAGGIYHVYARGNDRREIFADDRDRRAYLAFLARLVGRRRWWVLSYCLMANHVHLLVETPAPDLGGGMQWLHGEYGRHFNRRHRRSGHLFQGRYGAARVEDDAQLWMTVGYIVRNPVEAGLCAEAEHWPWGSHAAALDRDAAPAWLANDPLHAYLGGIAGGDGAERYGGLAGPEASTIGRAGPDSSDG